MRLRSALYLLIGALAASGLAQTITINGVADKTPYTDVASFSVPVLSGYSYAVMLDGQRVPAILTNVVTAVDYHEVTVWRTNVSTLDVSNRTVRFIVQSSNRGDPERGLIVWVPYPPIPSTASEFSGAQLHIVAPQQYPTGLQIPVAAWVDDGNDRIVRGNGWVTAPGFIPFRVVRGHGFGVLPAAAEPGTIDYPAALTTLSAPKSINIEASTTWSSVGGVLPGDTTWAANSRISVAANLTIPAGATLTVEAGTIVKMSPMVNITNNGTLLINGTLDQPVVFTPTNQPTVEQRNSSAWGGIVMRGGGTLVANGAILTGAGGAVWPSGSFSPGSSHRSEQPLLLVHSNALGKSVVLLTNCFLLNQAGQIANGYNSDIIYDHCLLQRAITSGESVGGTIVANHSAIIEFPAIDDVYSATIADADYDAIYFTTGTHIIKDTLIGFSKDDALDSGSGGAGTVLVTNCWMESALHEALAWSGEGRQTWTYHTVNMNCGQGIECGWTGGTANGSPNCFADNLLTTGNSVGARVGDNYDWSYYGFLRLTNSLILYNYRNILAKTWNTTGSSWDTNQWVDRLAQMDLRGNYLSAPDSRFPTNSLWNPSVDGARLAPFMTTPAAAPVGIGFAVWTNQFAMSSIFAGVPVRLSLFTTHPVSVDYQFVGSAGTLGAGTLTFAAGETVKRIYPSGFNLDAETAVHVLLTAPQGGEITGVSDVTYAGSLPARTVSFVAGAAQEGMERVSEGVPIRLSGPAAHPISISYRSIAPSGTLTNGTVTFNPGETLAWVPAPGISSTQYDVVRFDLLGSPGPALAGATNLYFIAADPAPAPLSPVTFLPRGGRWKYLDNASNPGTAWRTSSFDDSAWPSGAAELGFGDGDEATVVRRTNSAGITNITIYFRSTFVASNAAAYTNLSLWLLRDDGGVAYLNGTEVFRSSSMPPAPATISYNTFANNVASAPPDNTVDTATVPASALVNGTNVVAVEIHQFNLGSSDLSFNFELIGNPAPPTGGPQHLRFGLLDGGLTLGWGDSSYLLEQASTATGVWTQVTSPSPLTVQPTNAAQFYRLRR